MKDILHNLSQQLSGEVTTSETARKYFSTDGSIFSMMPKLVIYPRHEEDIIHTVKYLSWEAQEGRKLGITARGKGTDQGGGALGDGAMLVFPAHMKRLIHIDKDSITVEPGMIYAHLQDVLHSHHRYLPPYPASIDFCTIGGAVANNAAGEKTLKYGSTRDWVKGLRVVLSNGDVIVTGRLTKKELKKKKQQADYEGHLYRELDKLLTDNQALLAKSRLKVSKNSTGYDLWDIKHQDGSFDLSQLFVGSQGTLGIVTQATFYTAAYNSHTTLLVGHFHDIHHAEAAVKKLLPLRPSTAELVDHNTLAFLHEHHPEMLRGFDLNKLPQVVLLVEFDNTKQSDRNKLATKAQKIMAEYCSMVRIATTEKEQTELWRIRRGAAALIWTHPGAKKALPIIEDGIVPVQNLAEYLRRAYALFDRYHVKIATWGHAGNGNMHMQPFLDLSNLRDRKKIFDITDDYYKMIIGLHGSTSAEHNDGIMRAPYLKELFGVRVYKLFEDVKALFDPLNLLNPSVKIDVTRQDAMIKMRKEYSMKHLNDHLPASYNH